MKPFFTRPDELEAVLLAVLSNEASDQEIAALRQALDESEELRRRACELLYDDALITAYCRTEKQRHSLESQRGQQHTAAPLAGTLPSSLTSRFPRLRQGAQIVNRHGLIVAALAACMLVAVTCYVYVLESKLNRLYSLGFVDSSVQGSPEEDTRTNQFENRPEGEVQVLGRVVGLEGAVWARGTEHLEFGDRILLGQELNLESGLVELLLTSGAKVTIEGPARFEATSELEGNLTLGKIAAAAPRVARGYTVLTPTSELVDIGTRFGVMVDEQGDSELHVFDGDVVARSLSKQHSNDLVQARENEAMRFTASSTGPERFAARRDSFVEFIQSGPLPSELPPLPVTDKLSVWYAADMCTEYSVGEAVSVWRDLLVGDNDFADNAWQFEDARRPRLMEDQSGHRALRFDGWATCLETSPIDPSRQQTFCFVCLPAPNSYADGIQGQVLLKYGNGPAMELGLVKGPRFRGWAWTGKADKFEGEVQSGRLPTDRPSVIVYEYDTIANHSRLWIDGKLKSRADAPIAVLQPGCKYIGSHNRMQYRAKYFGGLYEMAIYDKCFKAKDIGKLSTYFKDRYDIE